jgi:hypothetical protein
MFENSEAKETIGKKLKRNIHAWIIGPPLQGHHWPW